MSGRVAWGAVGAALLIALAGCTGGPAPDRSATVDRSVAGYVDQVDPAEQPIAEFTADAAGDADGQVKVQVLSLEVTGDVMLLRVALTPLPIAGKDSSDDVGVFKMIASQPVLSDVEHMVVYQQLSDQEYPYIKGWAVEDITTSSSTPRGVPFLYWAYYDAPKDHVGQLDLTFNDTWPVVEDVPVVWS